MDNTKEGINHHSLYTSKMRGSSGEILLQEAGVGEKVQTTYELADDVTPVDRREASGVN